MLKNLINTFTTVVKKEMNVLKFKFYSITDIDTLNTPQHSVSDPELYFNEHFDELRQRIFYIFNFLLLFTLFIFYHVKLVVKILESPVSNLQFFQLSPGEYFITTLIISFYAGMLFCTPVILSQIIFFFKPALTKTEKSTLVVLVFSSIFLFLIGLLFSYFILIPAALNFFIGYGSEVIEPFLSFSQYFNFVSALFFSTGLVFQVPIIQIILSLSELVDPVKMLNFWRPMVLFSTILGAVLTPSADPLTQLLLSGALFSLYFLGSITSINLLKKDLVKR
uniref:Sec-independent periplasmic protein translocase n=1 Tax=Scytothamnus australis TaxID=66621 RepID=UPI002E78D80C|nr:Sec-independent periplasmic protein translocase [Scytothamnus australis]WAM64730.1 Sec-independent periplasmic protein translocase [Scytothamnus australis]